MELVEEIGNDHIVRTGKSRWVVVTYSARNVQYETPRPEGGFYYCSGGGERSMLNVARYAHDHGTSYRSLEEARAAVQKARGL